MIQRIGALAAAVAVALATPAAAGPAQGNGGKDASDKPFDAEALVEQGSIAAPGRVESLAAGMFDGRVVNTELIAVGKEHVRRPLPAWAVTLRKPDGSYVTIEYNAATLRILNINHDVPVHDPAENGRRDGPGGGPGSRADSARPGR